MRLTREEQIGFLLKRLQQALRNRLEARLRQNRTGVSLPHLVTLDLLDGQPGLSGAQLARRVTVSAQTMNQLLRRLEAVRAIERRPHPENRRVHRWFLTAEGTRQLQVASAVARPVMTHMLSRLRPDDIAQFCRYLETCVSTLESAPPGRELPLPASARTRAPATARRRK